jgi:glycerol-3-phosphate dehydrogenase
MKVYQGKQERVMDEQNAAGRQAALQAMAEKPLDVLVIGGGVTGAGVALDAAARGYRVGLVERGDFASGTSSWSTKLVHGGIRYLPEFDIALVREALIERGRLLRNASHLVHPLAFILPLYASSRHPVGIPIAPPFGIGLGFILDAGLWVYDVLAGKENVGEHRRISREQTIERAATLIPDGIKTGYIYYDAQTDDTRLTMTVLRTAAAHGAQIANYADAVRFAHEDERITGAFVRDTLTPTGAEWLVRARHVVNATGVWAEQTERLAGESPELHIAPSKGVHLVFDRAALGIGEEAIVLPETEDGRIIFIVPWQSRALVGTTDTPVRAIERPVATDDDISYLLDHLNRYLRRRLGRDDVLTSFAGNRPLLRVRRRGGGRVARLSRSHEVVESDAGLISVSGGKLTTYRRMAQDVLDRIDRREKHTLTHPTLKLTLRGSSGWAEARPAVRTRGRALGLTDDIIDHLGGAYGADALRVLALVEQDTSLGAQLLADLPYIRAEVVYSCREEMALTLEDVLQRRTHIALEDRLQGTGIASGVARLMAEELGWDAEAETRQIESYLASARLHAGPFADRLPEIDGGAQATIRATEASILDSQQ